MPTWEGLLQPLKQQREKKTSQPKNSSTTLLDDGLSAVYTFFEPDLPGGSLGTYGILWQIRMCQVLGLDYLYLGYWIEEARSMRYKSNFRPLEQRIDGQWIPLKD